MVAGILHDVIEDCVRGGYTADALRGRIGDKFGDAVLETVLRAVADELEQAAALSAAPKPPTWR